MVSRKKSRFKRRVQTPQGVPPPPVTTRSIVPIIPAASSRGTGNDAAMRPNYAFLETDAERDKQQEYKDKLAWRYQNPSTPWDEYAAPKSAARQEQDKASGTNPDVSSLPADFNQIPDSRVYDGNWDIIYHLTGKDGGGASTVTRYHVSEQMFLDALREPFKTQFDLSGKIILAHESRTLVRSKATPTTQVPYVPPPSVAPKSMKTCDRIRGGSGQFSSSTVWKISCPSTAASTALINKIKDGSIPEPWAAIGKSGTKYYSPPAAKYEYEVWEEAFPDL